MDAPIDSMLSEASNTEADKLLTLLNYQKTTRDKLVRLQDLLAIKDAAIERLSSAVPGAIEAADDEEADRIDSLLRVTQCDSRASLRSDAPIRRRKLLKKIHSLSQLEGSLRIVLKIGTSSLVTSDEDGTSHLSLTGIASFVETACQLKRRGHDVVLIASGSVGAGAHVLGLERPPSRIDERQALAAVGQVHLMSRFETLFASMGVVCSQVLLTYQNLRDRGQYLTARDAFESLMAYDVIPIVNENDTVATHELKFGDNDRLSAMVASLIDADVLVLLTDVDGLYTANPHEDKNAQRIPTVIRISDLERKANIGGKGSNFGTGGMATKITAAEVATSAGIKTVITSTERVAEIVTMLDEDVFIVSAEGQPVVAKITEDTRQTWPGTLFAPAEKLYRGRKKWILGLNPKGDVFVDDGFVNALTAAKTLSVFAAGVTKVIGSFHSFDAIRIRGRGITADGLAVLDPILGVGLTNYDSDGGPKIQ